jgi:uncharacterized protein YacL
MATIPVEIYYFIWISLIGLLFECWNNLQQSILNFTEYKINKKNSDEKKRTINIIEISTIFLFIISLLCFSFFISKIANITWIIIFLLISLISTYALTIFFNTLNIKLQKKDWVIHKDTSYNDFVNTLKRSPKRTKENKQKLHDNKGF